MSHQKTIDPFNIVDNSQNSADEEKILLDRIQAPYYQKIQKWFFNLVLDRIQPFSILEVGCGTGHLMEEICQLSNADNINIAGVDRSEYLIARASERFPTYNFKVADGRQLPFSNGEFDLVYIATVLVHAEEPEAITKEMVRVVRPGGIVAILDQDFETAVLYPGQKERTRRILNAATDFWQNGWIGREIPDMLKKAGLRNIDVDVKARIDRKFDPGFFQRIRDWVIQGGYPESEASTWYEELCNRANVEEFLFTRNFYSVSGIK